MADTSADDGQLYINGKFTDPSTGAVIGTVAEADPADVDVAVVRLLVELGVSDRVQAAIVDDT
jgi:ethanolamine utilization protein EutP (predicted NTPase)